MRKGRLLLLTLPLIIGAFYLRALASWRPKEVWRGEGYISQLIFSQDGKMLLVVQDPSLQFSGHTREKRVNALDETRGFAPLWQSGKITSFNHSLNPQFFASDARVLLNGTPAQILETHTGKALMKPKFPSRIVISPDGKWLVYGDYSTEGRISIAPASFNTPLVATRVIGNLRNPAQKFAFSPDGKTLVVGVGTRLGAHLDFYNTTNHKHTHTWHDTKRHTLVSTPPVYSTVQWSRNGQFLLSCWTYGTPINPRAGVDVWRVSDGKRVVQTSMMATPSIDLQDDGRFLITYPGVYNDVFLSNHPQNNFTSERLLNLFGEVVTSAAVSPDGSYLVAGTQSGRVFRLRMK